MVYLPEKEEKGSGKVKYALCRFIHFLFKILYRSDDQVRKGDGVTAMG